MGRICHLLLGVRDTELLHPVIDGQVFFLMDSRYCAGVVLLCKLVNPKDAPDILAVGTGLFAEAG